jgi:CRISPR/Cas system-associated protein Cas10 (large subunit of type III CRISPR-Cas system)
MTSILYRDKVSGSIFIYQPKYPAQRSLYEEHKNERIMNAIKELKHMGNIDIYLYKHGKKRLISTHYM